MKRVMLVLVILSTMFMVGCSNPETPAGFEGYVVESPRAWGNGGYQGTIAGPGTYGASLWRNKATNIDMRTKTRRARFNILTKDELNVTFDLLVKMRCKKNTVKTIVEEYGGNKWYEDSVECFVRGSARSRVCVLESRAIKDKRESLSSDIYNDIKASLTDTPFILESIKIDNIDYPEEVTNAVIKKLARKQELEEQASKEEIARAQARILNEVAEGEANAEITRARGVAEANKIIGDSLKDNEGYIKYLWVQSLNKGSNDVIYIPTEANMPIMEASRIKK